MSEELIELLADQEYALRASLGARVMSGETVEWSDLERIRLQQERLNTLAHIVETVLLMDIDCTEAQRAFDVASALLEVE